MNEEYIFLLEMAAKAYGHQIHGVIDGKFYVKNFDENGCSDPFVWNPIENSADALSLAGRLHIGIEFKPPSYKKNWTVTAHSYDRWDYATEAEEDINLSLKMAITRIAFSIGARMP